MVETLKIIEAQTLEDYYKLFYKYTANNDYITLYYSEHFYNAIYCGWDRNYYVYIFFDTRYTDYEQVIKNNLILNSEKIIEETFSKLESEEYQGGYKEVKSYA